MKVLRTGVFQASLPASGGFLACGNIPLLFTLGSPCARLSLRQDFPLLHDTRRIGSGALRTPACPPSIVTNSICNDPVVGTQLNPWRLLSRGSMTTQVLEFKSFLSRAIQT